MDVPASAADLVAAATTSTGVALEAAVVVAVVVDAVASEAVVDGTAVVLEVVVANSPLLYSLNRSIQRSF
ncbi:unnamed protein product [Mesocestoides corti]|uniref:Uncharacterized protein n=2 Tax=Mesocestoides corti TaxID=53468 RepID=A0A0R3UMA7_MESCO|nr:unnamed protein product [Mesocestoides corti]